MTEEKADALALAIGRAILVVVVAFWWVWPMALLWLIIHARVEGWLP